MSNGNTNRPSGVGASRQVAGSSEFTTVGPGYETRRLVLAYGIQFHKDQALDDRIGGRKFTYQEFMANNFTPSADIEKISDNEYVNHLQGVRFTLEETTKRLEFWNYLQMPEVHIIYEGHARYGRGPCFSPNGMTWLPQGNNKPDKPQINPSEDWEQGHEIDSGLVRMGYPFIALPVEEIEEYGYTANLVRESDGVPPAADCHPHLKPYLGSLAARDPERILPGLAAHLRGHQPGDRYWTYDAYFLKQKARFVIHRAGWRNTLSWPFELGKLHDPDDPDSTQFKCRCFSHFGCSTYIHNYPLVRHIANWRRQGNERYAYWLTGPGDALCFGPWIYALITYDQWNAFASWAPSLQYAVDQTNDFLTNQRYQVI